ncbi:MAG: diacylglycerol kinase family protein [Reyranella sp.]|uniref:diacylglycerol/lipid kinase family protein n=1 Tax=Reyranella sp. TaxID=1929291 RepID=UPI002731347C|nr:diacylglycerol kinase family protein [Reyranella sp.]MDP1962948.1 diacylglycerol kinase family protein [Reyranella sp.]MDP2375165.1 diacylglycerol kinase family protein [Reyranella sp.]
MTFASDRAVLLILNPTAGRRRRGLVNEVVRRVRAIGWTVDLVETAAAGDAQRIAETCDAARYAVIAVAGGDGTINEVVNGLTQRAVAGPALGIVPLGTANVLAHELGLGFSAAALAQTLTAGREILMQPGEASGAGRTRQFSLMAGAGFDAKVVAGVSAPLKRRFGRAAYVWRSLVEARRYRPVRYAVEIDGVRHEAASVIVTHGRLYAGPYLVAPDAALSLPLLYVCLFERWGRSQTLRFGLALLLGRLPRTAGYRVIAGRDIRLSVLSDAGEVRRQPVQIDGDDALTLPVSIALAAGAVRLLRAASG